MASAYPGSLDSFATDKANSTVTEDDHPGHHNDLADAVNKIEGELGVDPAGSESTVVDRLDVLDTTVAAKATASIIPQWIRYLNARQPGETAHADDDFFTDATYSGWTTLTVTGSQTITEQYDKLSVRFLNQTASDMNAALKAITSASAPMTIETCLRTTAKQENFLIIGMVMTDGTTDTSNMVGLTLNNSSLTLDYLRSGTMTNVGSPGVSVNFYGLGTSQVIYLRLVWVSANTFGGAISLDGISWTAFGLADQAVTLTPTHYGLAWSRWGGGTEAALITFDYFRVYTTDLTES